MADRLSGKVAVSELGDGHYLQFTFDAMTAIESALGEFIYLDKLFYGLPRLSPKCIDLILSHCVFDADGKRVKKSGKDWPGDEPLENLANYALDAVTLAHRGKTYEAWVADTEEKEKAKTKNPSNGTTA